MYALRLRSRLPDRDARHAVEVIVVRGQMSNPVTLHQSHDECIVGQQTVLLRHLGRFTKDRQVDSKQADRQPFQLSGCLDECGQKDNFRRMVLQKTNRAAMECMAYPSFLRHHFVDSIGHNRSRRYRVDFTGNDARQECSALLAESGDSRRSDKRICWCQRSTLFHQAHPAA